MASRQILVGDRFAVDRGENLGVAGAVAGRPRKAAHAVEGQGPGESKYERTLRFRQNHAVTCSELGKPTKVRFRDCHCKRRTGNTTVMCRSEFPVQAIAWVRPLR